MKPEGPQYYTNKEVFHMLCKALAASYIMTFTLITISYL